jgi:cation-transporting P-type ATPase E
MTLPRDASDGPRRWAGPPGTPHGLTSAEVHERVQRGEVNDVGATPTRSVRQIVRANVLTRFNFLIGSMLLVILVVAPIQDALFGLVALSNTLIGIVQELRAKRTLDRLSVISTPRARVVRDGREQHVATEQLVADDLLLVAAGEQLTVDGEVVDAHGLELNEALVTGESEPVAKEPGDEVLSGSFVVAGRGRLRAARVGTDSFAGRLTEQARDFVLVQSHLRAGIDRILLVVTWVLVPTAIGLLISQLMQDQGVREALAGSVAGTVAMIPEGLVLLTSVAFAAAVIRLGRRQVLVQELPAVETLARVDVVCFDKTGTLTTGEIRLREVTALTEAFDAEQALGALARSDEHPNATLEAIAASLPDSPGWTCTGATPFSSARRWSGASFGERGTWVLGAPEVVLAALPHDPGLQERTAAAVASGSRVVLLAQTDAPLADGQLPDRLRPAALVRLSEEIREDAADTVAYFQGQGIRVMLISGDHPTTVGAVARQVGLSDPEPLAGADLPEDAEELRTMLARHGVYGRVTPDHKRVLVRGLQRDGHVVAMTGDGVNDVLALKDADIGIAMGNGTAATRNVAQLVLLGNDFSTLPSVVSEGRRVIANIERVGKLFLTKTVYATLLAIAVGVALLPFPFLPRHLSLLGGLTIGVPAFFLALEPNERRARPGFVRRAALFALPAGVAAAAATFAAFWIAQTIEPVALEQARTTATVTLFGLGVIILRLVCRPLNPLRHTLVYGSVVVFLLTATLEAPSDFFALTLPPPVLLLAAIGIVAIAGVLMYLAADMVELSRDLLRREPLARWRRPPAGPEG